MSEPKIVVVGSANMDVYAYVSHLPEHGETVIGDRYWMGMGGKGANQAVGACRLGANTTLVGRVGQDVFGRQMLETLSQHGVHCDLIKVDSDAGSGVALVMVDERAENIISVIPGANMCVSPADVEAAYERIKNADVVMMQLEIPLDAIEKTLDIARHHDTLCILNPAPACSLPDSLLNKVDLLTPNQTEAKFLTGISADTVEGAEAAARALLAKGVKTVIITLGASGALIVQPDDTLHIDSFKVDAFDTSGAGDAFMGGLGVALSEGKTLKEAVRFANAVGALAATKPGAMPSMPSRTEVDALIQKESQS